MNQDVHMKSLLDIPEELYMEDFTPMEERLKNTDIEKEFQKLKEEVGSKYFEKYFNSLIKIKRYEKDMIIITHSENYRAIIIREYLHLLKKIFNVSNVIIVAQSK
ncbi:hypothetical protein FQB35_15335 [Crassaminicella thermophila]|uniref:Uncharacterized protein n=1 Tax=Crassaminicella thermophila TaxID=2599308 RepID=A0A5C0SHR2_CRATE|nr:hypothetical protein [Crassaminicella thermophila]QEK13522.1 hypothetical protein FQB35_15335 [Crassaminicella thermophila]